MICVALDNIARCVEWKILNELLINLNKAISDLCSIR